jgi:hypothetical protein
MGASALAGAGAAMGERSEKCDGKCGQRHLIEGARFAADSPLEGGRFEPSVPRDKDDCFHSTSPARLLSERDPRSEFLSLRHRICLTGVSPQSREAMAKRDRRGAWWRLTFDRFSEGRLERLLG